MKVSDFDYELPQELIAQDPLTDRSSSRLMVLEGAAPPVHEHFNDITDHLKAGDVLVLNNTKVIPARLYGERLKTGAAVEILLLNRLDENSWECLVKPGKKCRTGVSISFGGGKLVGSIIGQKDDGNRIIRFEYEGIFEEVLDTLGEMPLPPYITHKLLDKTRYQTVYAKYDGSAAAPTAGLHFTPELLDKIRKMGVEIAEITLHVGLGTFRPVKTNEVKDHHMHSEFYSITDEAADLINTAKAEGRRVICVGTTSVRALESAARKAANTVNDSRDGTLDFNKSKLIKPGSGWTDIFIYPGYDFSIPDAIITNFHLPKSTLIMLVCAFGGREYILSAYEEAVRQKYRFFSFGDAMFITSCEKTV